MARKKRKKNFGWKGQILLIVIIMVAVMFHSMALLLAIGMIPTIVAAIVDRSEGHLRAITVGCINFAGCAPFMIEVFRHGNSIDTAVKYILEPRTIVVMYFAAAMGYLIDWAMTGIVSSIMVQKTRGRLKDIDKEQKTLVQRWGAEVTGTVPLDEYGFAKEITPRPEEQPS